MNNTAEQQHEFGIKDSYEKGSFEEQRDLSLKVKKMQRRVKAKEHKEEYLVELESLKGKRHWDSIHHVQNLTKGYLSKVAQNFYSNLKRG